MTEISMLGEYRGNTVMKSKARFDWTNVPPDDKKLGKYRATLVQTDTYFGCSNGVVKTREEFYPDIVFDLWKSMIDMYTPEELLCGKVNLGTRRDSPICKLIFCQRSDEYGKCRVRAAPIDPVHLANHKELMKSAYGQITVVKKVRKLYEIGQKTHIYLDDVEGLGRFLEIEMMLEDGETQEVGKKEVIEIMHSFGMCECELLPGSYGDLKNKN
jgi:hypothetical protein